MDEEYFNKIIEKRVIPNLKGFLEAESAFFLYTGYDDGEGVNTTLNPAPDEDHVEEVLRVVAREIYKKEEKLPDVVISCEKIYFSKVDDVLKISDNEEGVLIVALEASKAKGFVYLYTTDMEKIVSHETDKDTSPPYSMTAISSYMHETLVQSGLVEEEEEEDVETDVKFRFSRN